MKKLALVLTAAAVCVIGRPGVSLAADTYWSCVREYTSQCRYIRDEWESCGELSMDIRDMCRSMYPAPPRKRPHR